VIQLIVTPIRGVYTVPKIVEGGGFVDWEADARERLERVPFFIRKRVKKQIEEFVRDQGGRLVTGYDVTLARRALAGGQADSGQHSREKAGGVLTAGELSGIEDLVEKGVSVEGLKTPHHEVRVCGGAAGCPLSLIDDRAVSTALAGVLNASGLDRHIAGGIDGPVLFHHKFRVTVSGCPNSCSQPQIVDFGVVGQSVPGRGEGHCTGCGLCAGVCAEKAVSVREDGPVFDYSRCQNCGQCIRSCPADAVREADSGYRVMAGGKLGRHPRLAEVVLELADEQRIKAVLEGAVRLFRAEGMDGERFAAMVDRLGMDRVKEVLRDVGKC